MPFLLLLLLTLTCLQTRWPEPPSWLGVAGSAAATWGGVLLLWILAAWITRRLGRKMLQQPLQRHYWLKRFAAWRRRHVLALLGYYLLALYFLGWGWTIKQAWHEQFHHLPGLEVLLLAPFFTGLVVAWSRFYDVERAAHQGLEDEKFPGRWSYVGLQARHNLLLIVPPLFLLLVQQGLFYLFPSLQHNDSWLPVLGIGMLVVAFISIPWILRWFLALKPLPPGPIRDRLEATARRLGFRLGNILLWDTRSTVANAMVTGVLPWMRYVVVTDRLLEELTPEEVDGVFGHEIGHVKHGHLLFYILFLLTSFVAMGGLWHLGSTYVNQPHVQEYLTQTWPDLTAFLEANEVVILAPLLALAAVYMFVVFGFLSRRCERQADIFGAQVSSPGDFINALDKVAHINGIPKEKPGWLSCWQHGTIAQRIAFLEKMRDDPMVATRFQRRVSLVKWSVAGCLVGLVLLFGPVRVWEIMKHL